MSATLEFKSISKTYSKGKKKVQALQDVSFSIGEGEVFGFVGPNGAGKSTTIKIVLDIINDYEGEVWIYGMNARRAEARKGVAYLPEAPALYEQFTPMEILRMSLRMYNIRRHDEKKWCESWLERLSIAEYADRKIRKLSKGNVQRVALAHAMIVQPRLLILDEPLSGLDPVGRKDVVDLLMEYKNEGGAIFFTSHVLHDVERIADRFGFINKGRLLTTRSPGDLLTEDVTGLIVRYQCQSGNITDGTMLRTGEYEYAISQQALPEWLTRLDREGGKLLSATPSVSLENVFFRILETYEEGAKARSSVNE